MSISQINSDQRVYGPPNPAIPGKPVEYFVNPLGIQSIVLSAVELGSSTALTTDTLQAFSVNVNLKPQAGASGSIVFPLLQGMGFVTAVYKDLQPLIQTGVLFDTVTAAGSPQAGVYKYQITLKDGKNWLLYAVPADGADPGFQLLSSSMLRGPIAFTGFIQIAKNPDGTVGETIYDASAGVYATAADIAGSVDNAVGTYSLTWAKAGHTANPLLMFALPHHMESFDSTTRTQSTNIQLQTTTKGIATAIMADSWLLVESNLPTDMGFAPWSPATRSAKSLSTTAQLVIQPVASSEVSQNMAEQTDLDSMYFSGKALSKFAIIVYTISKLTHDPDLATAGLLNLKDAFARFANNSQIYPLVYDTAWKGVVSTGSFVTGDPNQDFGNTYYNDHHFHYGYFIHTAAIIGSLDPDWLAANTNWVNMLVRDAGNPSDQDALFPFSRMFDWYHGHSLAKGLFESADGKDEESSSEDAFFAYAIKMWGRTTGDASMEARGNLMLSILARSLQNYFLLNSTNVNQPANFIENKATGIVSSQRRRHPLLCTIRYFD